MTTTDVRTLGCPQCDPVPRILGAADLDGNGTDEFILTHEAFDVTGAPVDVPTRIVIATTSGAAYRGIGTVPSMVHAREAVVADFNGDGREDVFLVGAGQDGPPFPGEQNRLLLSRPGGGHVDATQTDLPPLLDFAHGADAGDIDGDGDADIVVILNGRGGANLTENYFLVNDGNGRFSFSRASNHLPAGAPRRLNAFLTARLQDVDGDGNIDLLMAGNGDERQASLLLAGDGSGRFARPIALPRGPFGASTWTTDIDVVDLDRDGARDLVLLNTGRFGGARYTGLQIQILMSEGGRFVDRTNERMWGQDWPNQRDFNIPHNVTLADLDRDGHPDLVVQSLNPVWAETPGDVATQIGLNDGTGRFRPVDPRWLSRSSGYEARQLLPFRTQGRWALAGHSLYGQETGTGFRVYGQRLTLYR